MDLHDYKDVAENYDRYLDVMYADDHDNHEGFREFYYELAKKYGDGGVVDVACGTGAVLLYLAEHGIMADGTDLSEAMCRVADQKAKQKGFLKTITITLKSTLTRKRPLRTRLHQRLTSSLIMVRKGFTYLESFHTGNLKPL